jgi:hypothetical protein
MRNEPITLSEVADILGLEDLSLVSDKTYHLGSKLSLLDFEQMLDVVSREGPHI